MAVLAMLGALVVACDADSEDAVPREVSSADVDPADLELADSLAGADSADVTVAVDVALDGVADRVADAAPDLGPLPWTDGRCNGHEALCERRFDQVAFATSHNAFANAADGFAAPNHAMSMADQLRAGVRGLMLDVYLEGTVVWLCHGSCAFGSRTLVAGLREIDAFLDANPGEVVTLIFESYVDPPALEDAFETSGLAERVYVQVPGDPYPTLGEMVRADRRVLVMTDRDGGALPWLHDVWSLAFETHWDVQSSDGFSCDPNRGDPENALFILNHFLTDPIASATLAESVNHNPLLVDRARACGERHERTPNFVTVDFVGIGDLFETVDLLNGL